MDLGQIIEGMSLSKVCSIKMDKDSNESKSITLNVKFDGVTLGDVFAKAISSSVIQWQNGPGRTHYDTWRNGQLVNIDFKSPGRTQIDPKLALIAQAKAAGVDITDRAALTEYIMNQIS